MCFRLYPVDLIAGIDKIFLTVSVADEDKDVLRFLWLDDINFDLPRIKVLRLSRVVFGVSTSPFLLNTTIKHHIDSYKGVDHQFFEKSERSIYAGDMTFGAGDKESGFQLYGKVKCWLAERPFNLRTFHTNFPELQRRIDMQECQCILIMFLHGDQKQTAADDESYVKNTLGVNHASLNSAKVHGIQWDSISDQLFIDVHHIYDAAKRVEPTKRSTIGIVSRFYDPLEILSPPCTVLFKMLFQKLQIKKVAWDEPLKGELLLEWKRLQDNLRQVQRINIPLCYFGMGEKRISSSLIGFCDASHQNASLYVVSPIVT